VSDLKKIDEKLDKVIQDISEIKTVLAVNTNVLKDHTRRSTALEAIVLPLQKRANGLDGILKFLGILGILSAIGEGIAIMLRK
jgi:hypothetical protein